MPGPITYVAVTLLARDRIGQIKRALAAKKAAGNAKELDLHVLHLATEAERMMNATQPVIPPPVRLYGPPLTEHVSRFTLLGSVGPDLPRYAAYFAPGQRWLFDTLHKGTPDEHRERVLANSTNLVFEFWKRVGPHIDADTSNATKRTEARQKMQAYVLGHVCHIATDVLTHPYFEAIEARLATPAAGAVPAVRFMRRDDVAGAFDVRVSDTFFGRGTDTRTKSWADWFPTPGEVPSAFGKAMTESIAALYGARALGLPSFEETFAALDPKPPELSPALIDESISYFRTIMEIERVWNIGDWLGATAAMFLPFGLAYFGALVLPRGKDLDRVYTTTDGMEAQDQRTYEKIVYPVAVSSLGPLVSMIIVSASGRGLGVEGVTGWIQAGLSLVASVGFFASLGGAGAARWTLWFAVPLVLAVAQMIFVFARGAHENSRKLLYLGPLMQLLMTLIFMLLYNVWLHDGVEELDKPEAQRDHLSAWGNFAAWLGIVVVLWFAVALLWRYVFSSSVADDQNDFANGDPRQFARLYDDVSLVHDHGAAFDSSVLSDLSYPPARRGLLKLWWEAGTAANVQVRIDRDSLVFRWAAPAGTPDLEVFAPLAPITVERFGELLAIAVTTDAAKGTLHVKAVRDDEKGMELAPGAVFSDHGDVHTTLAQHDADAAAFKAIGATEADAFTLFHAPRPRLAQQMGRDGVVQDTLRARATSKAGSVLQTVAGSPRLYRATNAGDGTSPHLRKLLAPGDVLEIASGGPTGEQRIVEQVVNETDVIVSSPFTFAIPAAGIVYLRAASDRGVRLRGSSTVSIPRLDVGIGPNDVRVDRAAVTFGSQFRVGDTVEIGGGTFQRRRVTAVKDATPVGAAAVATNLLELDAPLSPPPEQRSVFGSLLQPVAGTPRLYRATTGAGGPPALRALFQPGDGIEIASGGPPGEQQVIAQVLSDTDIMVVTAFASAIPAAGIGYKRVAFIDRVSAAEESGFPLVADPSDVFGDSQSLMNDAADLAALLCLGAASRMPPNDTPVTPAGATKPVHRVYQIFRNWNLDRRRVNEWKLMVTGGATSERGGDFRTAEEAAPRDRADATEVFSDALIAQRTAADALVREQGWLTVFRSWVDMTSRARTDSTSTEVFRPGAPSNRDLSRAMAYLLDSTDGVTP